MNSIQPLTLEELADMERRHRSPPARKLLTEIWRLRRIEIQAEHFVRYLVRERYTMTRLPDGMLVQLADELGVPIDPEALRQTPPRPHLGVWTSARHETPAHRARSNALGHALTPLE